MALTFVTRKYICNDCGHSDKAFGTISKLTDIESYFATGDKPEQLHETKLYKEILVRDEIGIITERRAVEYPCDKCGSVNITGEKVENYNNVLNFYGHGEAGKWFEGFAKQD